MAFFSNTPSARRPTALSQLLKDIQNRPNPSAPMTVDELLEAFHERGFGFFLFIIALPAAIPIPMVGLSAIVTLPLLLLTVQQSLGFHTIWVPNQARGWRIESSHIDLIITMCLPWVMRLEKLVRPRLGKITDKPFSYVIGLFGLLMALAIALPIPFTNSIPAIGIVLMSAGVLMRDGLAVLAGMLIGGTWSFSIFILLAIWGQKGVDMIINIFSF